MLSEFEQIERSAGAEKAADVRKTLHFLLRRQFVFAGDARTAAIERQETRGVRAPGGRGTAVRAASLAPPGCAG